MPTGSQLGKGEASASAEMLSPTPWVFKPLAFSSLEKDTSGLEVFTVNRLSLAQDECFPGLVWVLLPNPACPLQMPTLLHCLSPGIFHNSPSNQSWGLIILICLPFCLIKA